MPTVVVKSLTVIILAIILFYSTLHAQLPPEPRNVWELPTACVSYHSVGKLVLGVSNKGYFGNSANPTFYDCILGSNYFVGSEFPKGSRIKTLREGSIWVGGVIKGDTVVSEGHYSEWFEFQFHDHPPYSEMNPDERPMNQIIKRSTLKSSEYYDEEAVSEEDLIAVYTDTFVIVINLSDGHNNVRDFLDFRYHKPLYIEVTQKSYAWSLRYAEDIVFFDLSIKNIGRNPIVGFEFGIRLQTDNRYVGYSPGFYHITGFIRESSVNEICESPIELNLAWCANNSGHPVDGQFTEQLVYDTTGYQVKSARDAIGAMIISAPDEPEVGYNWWNNIPDFGPMMRGNYRNYHTGSNGSPEGDRNKYFLMGNGEVDYDLAYTKKISPYNIDWMYPDQSLVDDIARGGYGANSVLSFEGGVLTPGSSIPIVFAIVAGENLHTDPDNYINLPDNPQQYYANLDFSDLTRNAQIARWIYDNPGIDTDGDGYAGEYHICILDSILDVDSSWIAAAAETTWYKGDGVPDWRVALPPPAPKMWVTPTFRGMHIRFNGHKSETSPDVFTQLIDFEGYRIYLSRDDRGTSYSRLASYDIENYDKWIWNEQKQPYADWDLLEFPMSLSEIRCTYASSCDDSLFDPLSFRPSRPYSPPMYPESLLYWEKHDGNVFEFGNTTDIRKRFPNARDPRLMSADSLTEDDFTDDGYFKFFEYEYEIEDLLPTVGYYASVTAFDFGWPQAHVDPLESSITDNAQNVFASVVDTNYAGDKNQIIVYPNPYRNDQNYRSRGFEGLGNDDRSNERVRRIHFANLPPKCNIRIFSLDGDLVREIHHDMDPNDPASSHAEWGLVSRNGLAVVSGLYYWVVEFPNGQTQMGKLAIIL